MTDLRNIDIPKIIDGIVFEYLCRDLWRNNSDCEFVEVHGRSGQNQSGVDVCGKICNTNDWFGIQCKVKSAGQVLTKKDIEVEINNAFKFNPTLAEFKICTTLSRDTKLQEIVRSIQEELSASKKFKFELLFWDDIKELLQDEKNIAVYHMYFQKYFADNKRLGHSIGKLFNLELGFKNVIDTHYELMLGKIPNYKGSNSTNVNYYRGTYFIVNFQECTSEVFNVPCNESDLINAFPNKIDRYRVVRWLSNIKNIDDFIYSSDSNFDYYITEKERRQYLESYEDE